MGHQFCPARLRFPFICSPIFRSSPNVLLYPRNLKFWGYYGSGLDAAAASAAAARQGLCFT